MIVLRLPIPPSVNGLYFNRARGRSKTERYRKWLVEADKWYYLQHLYKVTPINGKCEIEITLPKVRADIDNLCKAPIDWLVSRKLTDDDRNNKKITIKVDEEMQSRECWITIRSADYDPKDDASKCFDEAYRAVRERVAAGGRGWEPK